MQITVKEVKETLNNYDVIKEPIIVKRKDKEDVIIISMREYRDKILDQKIISKLKEAEKEIEEDEGIEAELVFKELNEKYDYK